MAGMKNNRLVMESDVESYLVTSVERRGGYCKKFLPDYSRGWPDRIVVLPDGKLYWIETKRPVGGKLSLPQKIAHNQLRRLGQQVEVIWSKEQVDCFLRSVSGDPIK